MIALLFAGTTTASADTFHTFTFTQIGGTAPDTLGNQLVVGVTNQNRSGGTLTGQARFVFENRVGIASVVTGIYFDDGAGVLATPINNNVTITQHTAVNFKLGTKPDNVPGGNGYNFTSDQAFGAEKPKPHKGLRHADHWLDLTFNLSSGKTFTDLITAFVNGANDASLSQSLRVGLQVQGIGPRGEDSAQYLVAPPPPPGVVIPAPAAALSGFVLTGLMTLRRRRPA